MLNHAQEQHYIVKGNEKILWDLKSEWLTQLDQYLDAYLQFERSKSSSHIKFANALKAIIGEIGRNPPDNRDKIIKEKLLPPLWEQAPLGWTLKRSFLRSLCDYAYRMYWVDQFTKQTYANVDLQLGVKTRLLSAKLQYIVKCLNKDRFLSNNDLKKIKLLICAANETYPEQANAKNAKKIIMFLNSLYQAVSNLGEQLNPNSVAFETNGNKRQEFVLDNDQMKLFKEDVIISTKVNSLLHKLQAADKLFDIYSRKLAPKEADILVYLKTSFMRIHEYLVKNKGSLSTNDYERNLKLVQLKIAEAQKSGVKGSKQLLEFFSDIKDTLLLESNMPVNSMQARTNDSDAAQSKNNESFFSILRKK